MIVRLNIDNQTDSEWKLVSACRGNGDDSEFFGALPGTLDAKQKAREKKTIPGELIDGAAVYERVNDTRDKICLRFSSSNGSSGSNKVGFRYYWMVEKPFAKGYCDGVKLFNAGEEHHTTVNGENLQCWYRIDSSGNEITASWKLTSCIF